MGGGMRVTVKIEGIDEALVAIDPKAYKKALGKTVRRMGQRFRSTATKEVRKTYNIKSKDLKSNMRTVTKTTKEGTEWRFYVRSPQINVVKFGARQTKKGVSVKIRKDRGRKVIKGAFIANGHFADQEYQRVFIRSTKSRLPIEAKFSLSVTQMFNKDVLDKAKKEVDENYANEFKHHLEYYLGKIR